VAILAAALNLMPNGAVSGGGPSGGGHVPRAATTAPRAGRAPIGWDLPARMVVATVFVVLLTGVAPALGPPLTRLLAPFPLYAAVLAGFAHALEGSRSAAALLRGLLAGLFGFAAFFLVLA